MDTPKRILEKWVEYMNTHEADALAELYDDQAVNIQLPVGVSLNGKTAIHNDFKTFFKNIPDNYTKLETLFQDGDWVILEWSGGGTFSPTGKRFALKGCGFFHISNGKIILQRGYWDKHTLFSQVGLQLK